MDTKEIRNTIHNGAAEIDKSVDAVASALSDRLHTLGKQHDELQEAMRGLGQRTLANARDFGERAAEQAHKRPMAIFGIAFLSGAVAALALSRPWK
ncbi:MAG: hypothetical protein ABI411_20335 [Tahibacter sp.]